MKIFVVFLGLAIFLMLAEEGAAECCNQAGFKWPWNVNPKGRCLDCGKGTPFCGRGACNIFGCNCDGGCRPYHGKCRNAPTPSDAALTPEELVADADADGDGRMSVREARAFLSGGFPEEQLDTLDAIDADNDGYISADEMDVRRSVPGP